MQVLTILRGLPGAGKSTFAAMLSDRVNTEIVEADQFFTDDQGNYSFDPLKLKEAHAWCLQRTKDLLSQGKSVVVANANSRVWEFEDYMRYAEENDIMTFISLVEGNHGTSKPLADPAKTRENMRRRWEPYAWA
jgi:predicted kinase